VNRYSPDVAWTEDETELLLKLHAEGQSSRQVGKQLGRSHSSVIGRLHRLADQRGDDGKRLYPQLTQIRRAAPARIKPSGRMASLVFGQVSPEERAPRLDLVADAPALAASATTTVKLLDLGPRQCRWPHGDPGQPGFGFCGMRTEDGRSYCGIHQRRAYSPQLPTLRVPEKTRPSRQGRVFAGV